MKTIIIILGICFLLACGKDEAPQGENPRPQTQLNDTTIIYGTWKFVEEWKLNNLGLGWWSVPAEYQYVLKIRHNGTFSSSAYSYCTEGTFSLKEGIFEGLTFPVISFRYNGDVPCGSNKIFIIEEGYLFLTSTSRCDEGCGEKFKRIK